ncbi:MAG TPA: hypothetical protein VFY96_16625, partial [Candidatus Binatia bacterium]|nr:hypothetical protein [Candidatus Binatia bacterium]
MMLSGSETLVVRSLIPANPLPLRSRKSTRRSKGICRPAQSFAAAADQTELIERLKSGDQRALETIFDLYSVKLYNVALRILGEPADTEEV